MDLELPQSVQEELLRSTKYPDEGFDLIAENKEDIAEARSVID